MQDSPCSARVDKSLSYVHIDFMSMQPEKMFRVLAFQPDGKDLVKGEEARGTLSIVKEKNGDQVRRLAKFIRDAGDGSDCVDFEISGYEQVATDDGPPQRIKIILSLLDGKKHSFIAFKEIPIDGAQSVRVTIVKAAMNPGVMAK